MNESSENRSEKSPSEKSEARVAAQPATIVGTYARWTLDCLIEAAILVSHDYSKRHRQYRTVPDEISKLLSAFRTKTGSDPVWPNFLQRGEMYSPLLGSSDGNVALGLDRSGPFHETSGALRAAAIAYSERVYDTGEPMLKQAFVDAARHFRAYLSTLTGSVVDTARDLTKPMFLRATRVLSTAEVAQAFGLPPAPAMSWPLPDKGRHDGSYLDGNGAYLVEEIFRTLRPMNAEAIKQQSFLTIQRVAAAGATTVAGILSNQQEGANVEDAQLSQLIGNAYTWSTALRDLKSN